MDKAKKSRESALGQFTRQEKKIKKALEEETNHWALEQMYGELKVRYNTTEVAHDEYVSYLEEIGDSEDWLERVAQRFDELEKEIGDKLSKLSKGEGTRKQVGVEKQLDVAATGGANPYLPGVEKFRVVNAPPGFNHGGLVGDMSRLRMEQASGFTDQNSKEFSLDAQDRSSGEKMTPPGFNHGGLVGDMSRLRMEQASGYTEQNSKEFSMDAQDRGFGGKMTCPSSERVLDSEVMGGLHRQQDARASGLQNLDSVRKRTYATGYPMEGERQQGKMHHPQQGGYKKGAHIGLADAGFGSFADRETFPELDSREQWRLNPRRSRGTTNNVIKIDKFKFHAFEGDIRKYPQFKYEFANFIEPQCDDHVLAFVLKNHLSSSVQDEVNNAMGDYRKMWARLEKRYGNVGRLIDAILYDVKNLACSYDKSTDAIKMINVVEKASRDLEQLGKKRELYNTTTISIIEQAMSMQMKTEWVRWIEEGDIDQDSRVKFEALLDFLGKWRNRLEYLDASIRESTTYREGNAFHAAGANSKNEDQKDAGRGQASNGRKQGEKRKIRCWLCNVDGSEGEHAIWVCSKFSEKSVKERQNLVKVNNACQRCLEIGCPGAKELSKCRREFKCVIAGCGGNHNRLLHARDGSAMHAQLADGSPSGDPILPLQSI